MTEHSTIGVVVIGRNEGERLKRCLSSIQRQHEGPVVYVDSGSTDGSGDYARSIGVNVVDLDVSIPFTMARGRNAGFTYLIENYSDCQFVQFIDGDCELDGDWIASAYELLSQNNVCAAVCGNRSERFPLASIYNRLIDLEWQGICGVVDACGGDAMYRISTLNAADGFYEPMIAGEEGELCLRLRNKGSTVERIDKSMTMHDANMQYFSQWWLRSVRCGHAYAHGYDLHSHESSGYKKRQVLNSLTYGFIFPILFLIGLMILVIFSGFDLMEIVSGVAMISILFLYVRMMIKTSKWRRSLGNSPKDSRFYTYLITLGKLPEAQGVLKYYVNKLFGKTAKIIEYRKV